MNHHIMKVEYEEKYSKKLIVHKTVLYDGRDYDEITIFKAIKDGSINKLRGVIECYTPDFEQCFRSLINKEDNENE